jgi:UDP-N-acetylmuramyl pentapeptide phosphotransferase/UDP-N-acetylglucosamine-1-phosphate transferase
MGCWLALGFLIAWIAVFWNHTLVHPFFMARMLVIPVMCGAVAIVVVRAELRRRAGPGREPAS